MANKEQIDLKTRRAARLTAQGVSRSDIAKKLGVSSRTLSRYESSNAFSEELQTIIKSERQTVGATLTSAARRALQVCSLTGWKPETQNCAFGRRPQS